MQLHFDFTPKKPQKPRFTRLQQAILYALKHEGAEILENPFNGYIRLERGYAGRLLTPRTLEALKQKGAIKQREKEWYSSFNHWVFAN